MRTWFWIVALAVAVDAAMLTAVRFFGYDPIWLPMAKQVLGCQ